LVARSCTDRRSASLRQAISGSHAAISKRFADNPAFDGRSADEIIGYDEFGVPQLIPQTSTSQRRSGAELLETSINTNLVDRIHRLRDC
jgi:hypothetical protein